MRPPLSAGRLQLIDADTIPFRLKTPWSDGTTHLLLSPLELIEKLSASRPSLLPRRIAMLKNPDVDIAPQLLEGLRLVGTPTATAYLMREGYNHAYAIGIPAHV
ncbi:MAG: hypothetical protein HOC74_00095, partial [Gemmatimonadetes bacterium]|nr:hypothetical protein [Gemmatimonadota bacterium]